MTEKELLKHSLIPKQEKLSSKEKEELFAKHNITFQQLPIILVNDPSLKSMDAKVGDVIKVTRKSAVAGTSVYYRGVNNE